MSRINRSIDGLVSSRGGNELGDKHYAQGSPSAPKRREIQSITDLQKEHLGTARQGKQLGHTDDHLRSRQRPATRVTASSMSSVRADINASLRELDEEPVRKKSNKPTRKERKKEKNAKRTEGQRRRRLLAKFIFLSILVVVLAVGGVMAYKLMKASDGVLNGGILDFAQNEPLKKDSLGRSNFLILGTSEDDPGHEASYLTDSMLVVSVDQEKKDAYMFSVPRDLYVSYGQACLSGYRGKINEFFNCSNPGTDDAAEQDRLKKTQAFVGQIFGMEIQYGVHVNYTVVRDVVNAVGGSIQVDIEGNDGTGPSHKIGILDSNFDWKCGNTRAKRLQACPPNGHFIDLEPGIQTLDAERALYLAQARGASAPTYGLAQSNPDRERNQQKIIVAIRDKAMSAGTLTNIGAVASLIDALGNNLRTNIETKEIRTLLNVAQKIPTESINSIDFFDVENPILTTGNVGSAGSSAFPVAGLEEYDELQEFIRRTITSDPVVKEDAVLAVMNASGVAGAARSYADVLEEKNFVVDTVGNAPIGSGQGVVVYQIDSTMKVTAARLEELYGVKVVTSAPPISVNGNIDFVVLVGSGAPSASSQ